MTTSAPQSPSRHCNGIDLNHASTIVNLYLFRLGTEYNAMQLIWAKEVVFPAVVSSMYNHNPVVDDLYPVASGVLRACLRRLHVSSNTMASLLLAPEDPDLPFKPSLLIGSPELDRGLVILKVRGRPLGLSARLGARGRCLPRARPPI